MTTATTEPTPDLTMEELLGIFPGARRTLFQLHHIGGCSSCGFSPAETLAQICARNGGLDPATVLGEIREGHLKDEALLISPIDLHSRLDDPGSRFMTQEIMQEAMNWPKETAIFLIDHTGGRVLDAAAYFAGHGFTSVKGLKGGIDAYSTQADPSLPRYTTEAA